MNYLAKFDESIVIGYLKSAGTTDSDVLHSRHESLVSHMELGRKLAFLPMGLGCVWALAGVPLMFVLVGFLVLPLGLAVIYGSVWGRKRLAANIAVANSAYTKYLNTVRPNVIVPPLTAVA
jgi:hypothetical protein